MAPNPIPAVPASAQNQQDEQPHPQLLCRQQTPFQAAFRLAHRYLASGQAADAILRSLLMAAYVFQYGRSGLETDPAARKAAFLKLAGDMADAYDRQIGYKAGTFDTQGKPH